MSDLVKELLADKATDPRVMGSPEMELRWKAAAEITRLHELHLERTKLTKKMIDERDEARVALEQSIRRTEKVEKSRSRWRSSCIEKGNRIEQLEAALRKIRSVVGTSTEAWHIADEAIQSAGGSVPERTAAMHASAPEGHKCSDCTIDEEPCPICYAAWWQKRHPNHTEIVNWVGSVGVTRTGTGLCPFCDHRIADIELQREDDGELHCNHCRGERQTVPDKSGNG